MTPADTDNDRLQAEQAEVIAFLTRAATHGGAAVETVETHVSVIFLAGERAYKLKRPQKLTFLDFSTPDLREAACRRELEVNAIAGDLYLGVCPVRRLPDGSLTLGGEEGEAVDWVVVMRRFDRTQEFDKLLDRDALTRHDMALLGDRIAAMHAAAPVHRDMGGAEATASTARNLAEALGAPDWLSRVEAGIAAEARRLEARCRHGFVRRCHGDLHLANIVMIDGAPTPFDAIEFSETIATTDIGYDIAFSVMDLLSHGRADLANALVCRYLSATRDYSGLALAPLFVSIRAAVRAMTATMRGAAAEVVAARRAMMETALAPRPAPSLTVVAGLSGSGKSTLSRALAPRIGPLFGAVIIASDVTRKRMYGVAPETPLPAQAYRPDVSAKVYRRMCVDARRALLAGCSVILDGVHSDERSREPTRTLADELGVAFRGIWLLTSNEERIERVAARKGDPSDADVTVARAQRAAAPWKTSGWSVIRSGGALESVVEEALSKIKKGV